jgi:hypothetical protein
MPKPSVCPFQIVAKLPYEELRPLIRSGWGALFRDESISPVSAAIRKFSWMTHYAVLIRSDFYDDRITTAEAITEGLVSRIFSERIKNYHGRVFLFEPDGLKAEHEAAIKDVAWWWCAKNLRYDFEGLVQHLWGRPPIEGMPHCTEFGVIAWHEAKYIKELPKVCPRPGDIPVWFSGKLREIDLKN